MGLDMYLFKRHYVQNWDHTPKEERFTITVAQDGKPFPEIEPARIAYIIEEVASWRKANAIHRWFVQNVQGGEDDCKEYLVEPEQLQNLLKLVETALSSPNPAKVLPTQHGYLFGDTKYGEDYRQDLEDTKEMLEKVLAEPESGAFFYRGSW